MKESLDLFGQIVNNKFFAKSSFILFLNKKDILEKKLMQVSSSKSMSSLIWWQTGRFLSRQEGRQTDIQTDRQAEIKIHKSTVKHAHRHADRNTDRKTGTQTVKQTIQEEDI